MIYLLFALCIFVLDLLIKKQIEAQDEAVFPIRLTGGFILKRHHNYGFALNRLDRRPKLVRWVCFLIFFPLCLWSFRLFFKKSRGRTAAAQAVGKFGFSFLLGGAASNLYDRFFRGYVVDYLALPKREGKGAKKIRNIIFNIADFFIFIGGILTAVYGLFTEY